jgi:hypothetical protein
VSQGRSGPGMPCILHRPRRTTGEQSDGSTRTALGTTQNLYIIPLRYQDGRRVSQTEQSVSQVTAAACGNHPITDEAEVGRQRGTSCLRERHAIKQEQKGSEVCNGTMPTTARREEKLGKRVVELCLTIIYNRSFSTYGLCPIFLLDLCHMTICSLKFRHKKIPLQLIFNRPY